jgi:hypothetical protein
MYFHKAFLFKFSSWVFLKYEIRHAMRVACVCKERYCCGADICNSATQSKAPVQLDGEAHVFLTMKSKNNLKQPF